MEAEQRINKVCLHRRGIGLITKMERITHVAPILHYHGDNEVAKQCILTRSNSKQAAKGCNVLFGRSLPSLVEEGSSDPVLSGVVVAERPSNSLSGLNSVSEVVQSCVDTSGEENKKESNAPCEGGMAE